jgi:hypothetical protein
MKLETHHLSLIDHAPLHMLLRPDGQLPEILDVQRTAETGSDVVLVSCNLSGQRAMLRYHGPTMVGVGPAGVADEKARIARLRAALDAYERDLDATLAFFAGR